MECLPWSYLCQMNEYKGWISPSPAASAPGGGTRQRPGDNTPWLCPSRVRLSSLLRSSGPGGSRQPARGAGRLLRGCSFRWSHTTLMWSRLRPIKEFSIAFQLNIFRQIVWLGWFFLHLPCPIKIRLICMQHEVK